MTYKTNIDGSARTVYYALSGNNNNAGKSIEDPKLTVQAAIDEAVALTPPPQVGNSATVVTAQVGSFDTSFILQDFISFDGNNATITIDAPVVVTLASFLNFEIRGVINTRDSATNFLIDGEQELGVTTLTSRTTGAGSKGFEITGSCGNLTFNASDGSVGGDSSVGFSITSTTTVPITINTDAYVLEDDNTVFMDFNPVSSTDNATANVSSITSTGSNTTVFLVQEGQLTVEFAGDITATTFINVKSGATLTIYGNNNAGNIIVDSGGTLICNLLNHTGTVTNNGTITGIINNVDQNSTGFFFKNINARDTFFDTAGNEKLLQTGILATVNQGNAAAIYEWTGDDQPAVYDADLFIPKALNSGPGTLFLGEDGAQFSSAGKVANFVSAYNEKAISLDNFFDADGSRTPIEYSFEKEQQTIVADVFSSTLSAPTNLPFVSITVSSYSEIYHFRPATTGTLRVRSYAGLNNLAPIVEDQTLVITGGDIGNVVDVPITGLLNNPGDDLFIEITGVDLFGGLQTSGTFNGQTVPYFETTFHLLTPEHVLTQSDLDQYALLNPEYRTATVKNGGLVVNTLPTATTDTFTGGLFTAGVASTSNPTLVTDGSGTFSADDLILINHSDDLLDSDQDDGLYEVLSHSGTTLTIKGVGVTAATEDFVKDQFLFQQSTGFITKVGVSVLRATDTEFQVGFGNTTPLTFNSVSDTPTPGGSDTQVQFNNAGTLDGTERITIDASGSVTAHGLDITSGSTAGGDLNLRGGNSFNGVGGEAILAGGSATNNGAGGGALLKGGEGGPGTTTGNDGGPADITAGDGGSPSDNSQPGDGGGIAITPGVGGDRLTTGQGGLGGTLFLTSGTGGGPGGSSNGKPSGDITVITAVGAAGPSAQNGSSGDLKLETGNGVANGRGGNTGDILLTSGTGGVDTIAGFGGAAGNIIGTGGDGGPSSVLQGGNGGDIEWNAGAGGLTTALGTTQGGFGGNANLIAGDGGSGIIEDGLGGNAGDITITSGTGGDGGTTGTGVDGDGGDITLTPGIAGSGGVTGGTDGNIINKLTGSSSFRVSDASSTLFNISESGIASLNQQHLQFPFDSISTHIEMGAGSEFFLRHDGTNSAIETTTGDLTLEVSSTAGNNITAFLTTPATSSHFEVRDISSTTLFRVRADGLTTVETNALKLKDNVNLEVGSGVDFNIVHDGSNTIMTNATGNLTINNTSGDIVLNADVGVGIAAPVTKLHIFEDTASTDDTTGLRIEQDGTGDAAQHFIITGAQSWNMGIDNDAGNAFKISTDGGGDVGVSTFLTIQNNGMTGIGIADPLSRLHVKPTTGDTVNVLTLETSGANAGTASFFTTDRDPNGNITPANIGDIVLSNATDGAGGMYIADALTSADWGKVATFPNLAAQVDKLSDLPAPVGGIIDLDNNINYEVHGTINLGTNQIRYNTENCMTGGYPLHGGFIYTGTGAVFLNNGTDVHIHDLEITASSGSLLNLSNAPDVTLKNLKVSADSLGTLTDIDDIIIQDITANDLDSGLLLAGAANRSIKMINATFNQDVAGTGTLLDFGTSVFDVISITNTEFRSVAAGTEVSGAAASANLTVSTGRGRLSECIFGGSGTPLVGITIDTDVLWKSINNFGLADTQVVGSTVVNGNTTETTITTINTYVDLNLSTSAFEGFTNTFFALTNTTTGETRYDGIETLRFIVGGSFSVLSPGSQNYTMQVLVNGSTTGDTIEIPFSTDSSSGTVPLSVPVSLDPTDLVRLQVQNTDGTDNITITDLSVTIS